MELPKNTKKKLRVNVVLNNKEAPMHDTTNTCSCDYGETTVSRESRHDSKCGWEGDVVAVVAPLGGVAQVVSESKSSEYMERKDRKRTGKCRWK